MRSACRRGRRRGGALRREPPEGGARGREIIEQGGRAGVFGADLREASAAERLIGAVEDELGAVDLLAANAGMARVRSIDEIDADAFDESVAVNLRAPFLLARRVLPGMLERGFGRILFTSSVAGFVGGVISADYARRRPACTV